MKTYKEFVDDLRKEDIVFALTYSKEDVQDFAESNFKEKLTDDEINQLMEIGFDSDHIADLSMHVLYALIKEVLDERPDNKSKGQ